MNGYGNADSGLRVHKTPLYIVTHGGAAHRDDVASVAILLADYRDCTVYRRDPRDNELDNPNVVVVDVGMAYDPAKNNYDHHQLDRKGPPECAFTLVLKELELLEHAERYTKWVPYMRIMDDRGPDAVAKHLGIHPEAFEAAALAVISPFEGWLLEEVGRARTIVPGSFLHHILMVWGKGFQEFLVQAHARRTVLDDGACALPPLSGVFVVDATCTGRERPLDGVYPWLEATYQQDILSRIALIVTLDDRGPGCAIWRRRGYRGEPYPDLYQLDGHPNVAFAHLGGFVAKTRKCLGEDELEALVKRACAEPEPVPEPVVQG